MSSGEVTVSSLVPLEDAVESTHHMKRPECRERGLTFGITSGWLTTPKPSNEPIRSLIHTESSASGPWVTGPTSKSLYVGTAVGPSREVTRDFMVIGEASSLGDDFAADRQGIRTTGCKPAPMLRKDLCFVVVWNLGGGPGASPGNSPWYGVD